MEKHIKARPFDDNSRVNLVVANDTCTDVCAVVTMLALVFEVLIVLMFIDF